MSYITLNVAFNITSFRHMYEPLDSPTLSLQEKTRSTSSTSASLIGYWSFVSVSALVMSDSTTAQRVVLF